MSKKTLSTIVVSLLFTLPSYGAKPATFKVNMRVGMKGSAPISVNTVAKSGKKSYVSQFSDDGITETLVTVLARKASQANKPGLAMDVEVVRRVRGMQKSVERAQVFAPENEEIEVGAQAKGRTVGSLSLAVMAHQL